MNLNELRDEAYSIAKANGWHEEEHNDEHRLMLIITEIAEAVQADRKNLHADVEAFKKYEEIIDFKENFERQIKNTVEDELADVVIRCLDLAGVREIDLGDVYVFIDNIESLKENKSFIDLCYVMSCIATCDIETDEKIRGVTACVLAYCRFRCIDIEWFIEQKMDYNRLRGYHHGGKKY